MVNRPNTREHISRFLKGAVVGLIIVLPGMSGGTLILVLGLYEILMHDLARMRLLPWLPFALGLAGGMAAGSLAFSVFLTAFTSWLMAFLLGSVLGSVRAVVRPEPRPGTGGVLFGLFGIVVGWVLAGFSNFGDQAGEHPGYLIVVIGAALASVAMVLPGVPGSSVLILFGIYDDAMLALSSFNLTWLLVFGLGAAAGILALSNLVDRIYARYRRLLSWFFAGLIIGSARLLIPTRDDNILFYVLLAILGFAVVWLLEGRFGTTQESKSINSSGDNR